LQPAASLRRLSTGAPDGLASSELVESCGQQYRSAIDHVTRALRNPGLPSKENIRTFAAEKTVTFNHPDRRYEEGHAQSAVPKLKNVNLLFGENACGKTTLLEAIALAALGPAVNESRMVFPAQKKQQSLEAGG